HPPDRHPRFAVGRQPVRSVHRYPGRGSLSAAAVRDAPLSARQHRGGVVDLRSPRALHQARDRLRLMLRLSAIGLETTHGFIYPAMLNGYELRLLAANSLDIVASIFPTGGAPSVDSDVRVVACYDPDPALAARVASAC